MYKRKLHKEISSGLLVLIVVFSLTGCGSSRGALEMLRQKESVRKPLQPLQPPHR